MREKTKKSTKASWYGVKTLFRLGAVGKPAKEDAKYDPGTTLVEERVVLFRARGFAEAVQLAEREARSYARHRHRNPYGQQVVTRYLGACDAYQLFDPPAEGREVFSTTELVGKIVTDATIVDHRLGHRETAQEMARRRNVLDGEFAGTGGVASNHAMQRPVPRVTALAEKRKGRADRER